MGRRGGQGCPHRCGSWSLTSVGGRNGASLPIGRVLATPGILETILGAGGGPLACVARHAPGDWGPVRHDRRENGLVLRHGWRVLSSYGMGEGRVWVIPGADRSVTTILLPEEYW